MPPRKRARASNKTSLAIGQADWDAKEAEDGGEAVSIEEEFEPTVKKAKKATTKATPAVKGKGKGKAGRQKKLEVFNTMPLDVLTIIMANLDTKTLLAMSRTCATFRRLLHSTNGTSIWKAARHNTFEIPDLKAGDLKEWEYASLLFDGTCHICQKPRAKTTDYTLRVRCCAECMKANSKRREKIPDRYGYHSKVWECVPESTWSPNGEDIYHFFWVPTLRQVDARLRELAGDSSYDDYLEKRKHIHERARLDAREIERWEMRARRHKEDDKEDVKTSRKRKITEKLTDLGYTAEELASPTFSQHKGFDQARDLSDNIWKRIKPILTSVLDQARAEKASQAAATAMKARAASLKPWYEALQASTPAGAARSLFPPWTNFLVLPSVRALYQLEDASPTQDDLNAKRPAVLQEARLFANQIKMSFFAKLAHAHAEASKAFSASFGAGPRYPSAQIMSGQSVEELAKLVTSAVPCPSWACQTHATFPAILDHFKVCGSNALTAESLTTSAERILAIRCVLAAINAVEEGKVSETTSTTDLHALGKAFKCQDCCASIAAVGVATWSTAYDPNMTWSQMATHLAEKHTRPSTGFVPPEVVFTPPHPLASGQQSLSGFFVEDGNE